MYAICIDGDSTEDFIMSSLPGIILKRIVQEFQKTPASRRSMMAEYLSGDGLPSADEIIRESLGRLLITTEHNDIMILAIDGNSTMHGHRLDALLRLIDFGNADIKGLGCISRAFNYIQSNVESLYRLYLIGGV